MPRSVFSVVAKIATHLTLLHFAHVSHCRARRWGELQQKKGKKVKARTVLAVLALLCAAQVRAHGGLVDLSGYDRTEGRRLAVHWREGSAYHVGKPGNEYQVSGRNRLRADGLAAGAVDAVNRIHR